MLKNHLLSWIASILLTLCAPLSSLCADTSAERWVDRNESTLLDTRSKLEWTRSDNGHDIDWLQSGRLCNALPGKWRLPSVAELVSLYESTAVGVPCGAVWCRVSGPFALSGEWFWSADPVGEDGDDGTELAWGVLMVNGTPTKSVQQAGQSSRVLCVRSSSAVIPAAIVQQAAGVDLPVDAGHTAVIFSWTHRGFSHPIARLEQLSGTLTWNRSNLAASSVSVSLPIEGLRTGDDALNRRLRGKEFFDAARYPTITYKSTQVTAQAGTDQFVLTGELTVHGVTRPVTLHATINKVEQQPGELPSTGFDADGILRRSEFGLGRYVPMVGDEIKIHITLEAHPG